MDPRFRNSEGIPTGAICLPLSVAVAGVVIGLAWRTPWRKAVLWFALALTGQAVSLQLIDAGTRLHYQHYRTITWILAHQPWHLLFVLIQAIVVALGFRRRWTAVRAWLRRQFRWWQLAGIAAVFWLTAATVSQSVFAYVAELAFAACLQTLQLSNIVLAAWEIPEAGLARLRECFDRWHGSPRRRLDGVVVGSAIWITVAAALLSWFAYERHPHIPDEVAYVIQARYFALGKLHLPAPPVPEAFELYLMDLDGKRWFSSMPPGWPAVLAIGVLVGLPWLINPLLAGLNTLLAWRVLSRLYDTRLARFSALLLAVSPWHVFMAMNFMSHTVALTYALLVALGVTVAASGAKWRGGAISGLGAGLALLVRPLEGFILGLAGAVWLLATRTDRRISKSALAAYALSAACAACLTFEYNRRLAGNPLEFPVMAYMAKRFGPTANAMGFGPDRGMGWAIDPNPGHSPLDALINANLNMFSINIELFGWGTGSLLLAALFVFAGRLTCSDWVLLAFSAGIFIGHFFYYFSGGPDFGARYWFLMLIPSIVFTIRGLQWLCKVLGPHASARAVTAVIALGLTALLNYFPWRAIDKYHHYQSMRPDVRELAEQYDFGRSLVLIRGENHPDYASAAVYNPLDLTSSAPIYAWDRSDEVRRRLLHTYSDRPVWILQGPTLTGRGYRVLAGPVPASELAH